MIELKDIYKIYGDGDSEIRALDGINLSVADGEFVAIVGQSGSGKSTAMNIIGCLDVPTYGQYFLDGEDVSCMNEIQLADVRGRRLGFIFQQYNLIPKLSVLENVELPLVYKAMKPEERRLKAMSALEKVGLPDRADKYPSQLSGGQQQRVSIARALAGDPQLILADEPTGALDSKTGKDVLDFISSLNDEGKTVVLITHDMSVAQKAKRIVRIQDGKIVSDEVIREG
ncbi:MAG: ABC transporter ATP-binding protein [Clostridia bacterium]|nr:ABC transporter ATP-binding protein [Clostridia bacterium]